MGILLGGLVLVVVGYLVWRKKNNKWKKLTE
jgi:LPXTG-motif cell wall-anchored protein